MSHDASGVPEPDLLVSTQQREKAQDILAEAYAEGRVTEAEFDQRLDQVLSARTRRELNTAFYGLVAPPAGGPARPDPPKPTGEDEGRSRAIAALVHLSALPTWIFGPIAGYLLAGGRTYVREQAAKAAWFQLGAMIAFVAAVWAAGLPGVKIWWTDGLGPAGRQQLVAALYGVLWVVLTTAGAANAALGDLWRNRPTTSPAGGAPNSRPATGPVV